MSDIKNEQSERWELYTNVCEKRFKKLDDKVDDLHATVKNGLTDKVKMVTEDIKGLRRLAWGLAGGIILTLGATIFDMLVNH